MNNIGKPRCELTRSDGNVFAVIAKVGKTLKRAGQTELAREFCKKAMDCASYDEVLRLCFDYVDVS
jgi:3,4-dihydroxy-2-butanone 4-phosphate synthase